MDELVKRLHRYSENCVAYKLDADFDKRLNREPPMWKVFAWRRWKRERPVWTEVDDAN